MIVLILAAALGTITPAQHNHAARQMDRLIDQIETLQDDADATGNTARTRPSDKRQAPRVRKGNLIMTFGKGGPTVR